MLPTHRDKFILRELIKQTLEIAAHDIQNTRRELWSDFNSLQTHQVPIYILDPLWSWREVFPQKELLCEHPLFRQYENWLRLQLYHASFGDDFITEPWITVFPEYKNEQPHWHTWGIQIEMERVEETLAFHFTDPPIKNPEDFIKLIYPFPLLDEPRTREKTDFLQDAVGDLIPVLPDYYPPNTRSLSYTLGYLLGPQQMMYQLHDQPEMVHALCRLVSDASITICDEAEKRGWFTNVNLTFSPIALIQAMAYNREIPSPGHMTTLPMKQCWIYDCAQEFEGISPEMFNEFLIEYQKPIYEKFGLTAYGCCENLTRKIKYLKKIKNLRRVAVTPWADIEACAELLEDKYIVSWRPHPAEMVGSGWDKKKVKETVRKAKEIFERYNCFWEINLKDFLTIEHDKNRLNDWVCAVRSTLD